jgi:hypothetical protein
VARVLSEAAISDRAAVDDEAMTLRHLLHGRSATIAGTVYGTIVVLSMLTAGASAYQDDPWRLVAIVASGAAVLWAAHVHAHVLGESVQAGRRLKAEEVAALAGRESAILLAAVLPVGAITLGAVGVLGNRAALWLAFGIGVSTLTLQALRYARLERLSTAGTTIAVGLNLLFGMFFVVLKVLLAH